MHASLLNNHQMAGGSAVIGLHEETQKFQTNPHERRLKSFDMRLNLPRKSEAFCLWIKNNGNADEGESLQKDSIQLDFEDSILRMNIGGTSYRIRCKSILKNGASTFLAEFVLFDHEERLRWCDWYFEDSQEYFFERTSSYFEPIFDFYSSGRLHVPKDLCFDKYMAELYFWRISKTKLDDCCSPFSQYYIYPSNKPEKDLFIGLRCAKLRRKLWLVLEGKVSSRWWKAFEITSTSFVFLSVSALIIGSLPEFQVLEPIKESYLHSNAWMTYPQSVVHEMNSSISSNTTIEFEMVEHPALIYTEYICVIYFALEYAIRFLVSPRKTKFVKEILNIIDLLAILPFIFDLILILIGISGNNVGKVRWAFITFRLLRVLRVVRIAKLGRFSPGLTNFALTLRRSKKQMQMVAVVMLTVVIFFSTLIYFLEKDEPNTTFTSIPAAFWWAVVTMSTVGYGDSVPQTIPGKLVGSGAIVCGVMVLALPITIMVNNFMQVVKLREEQVIKKYVDEESSLT